jgi:hypothetical protein
MKIRKIIIYTIGIYLVLSSIVSVSYFVGKQPEKSDQILNGIPKKITELIISPIRITRRFFIHEDGNIIKNKTIKDGINVLVKDSSFDNLKILTSYFENEKLTVDLIDFKTKKSVKKWLPYVDEIMDSLLKGQNRVSIQKISKSEGLPNIQILRHPVLMKDSSIVVGGESFFKMDNNSKLIWINTNIEAHHSLELDHENNIWISGRRLYSQLPELIDKENTEFLDDLIMKINPENGDVLFEKSVIQILKDNDLYDLIFKNGNYEFDPIHLNDVQPALTDSDYWKKGDLLISSRHLSTIILYRPSSNKILWYRQGTWFNQHDPDFLDGNKISVFGNQVFRGDMEKTVKLPYEFNSVFIYDFEKDSVTEPYQTFLESEKIKTITEGRSEILSNGDLFVEETNNGRIFIGDTIKKKLTFSKRLNDEEISYLHWSRIIKN